VRRTRRKAKKAEVSQRATLDQYSICQVQSLKISMLAAFMSPDPSSARIFGVAEDSVTLDSNAQSWTAKPRIPRENGFGDFVFGRSLYGDSIICENGPVSSVFLRPKIITRPPKEFWTEEDDLVGSGNAPVTELNGFRR
jgi:hypothetical protein